mgnify:CR=1 FL=1
MKYLLIIFLLLFSSLLFVFFYLLDKLKRQAFLKKGINLTLFLVVLPEEEFFQQEKKELFPLQDYLKNTEQFYHFLGGLKEKKLLYRLLFGSPYLVFEIAVHRVGEEIYFYVACPRSLSQMVEKQILAFWPKAQVQQVIDYNIFNPNGVSLGSIGKLSKNPIFPLKFYEDFKTDPMALITSIFTKLAKEGEGASVQFLVRPTKSRIRGRALESINYMEKGIKPEAAIAKASRNFLLKIFQELTGDNYKDKAEKASFNKVSLTPSQQEVVSAISKKFSKPLFDVNLRILASAPTQERAQSILSQLESAFEQFNEPLLNSLKFFRPFKKRLNNLFYQYSFRIFNEKEAMILSSGELTSLFHFPAPNILNPRVKWLKTAQAPAPTNLPEEGLIIGKNVFRGEERIVKISKDDRRRHFYIIGQTGTGKSGLIQELIRQDIENGEGVALIDPHGDLAEKVLTLIPSSRVEDVIYFNPGETERPIGLNMLEFDPRFPEDKSKVVNELLEIFEKLYNLKVHGFGGPIFEQYMRNSILLTMEDPASGNTIVDIPRVLSDKSFRKHKLSRCQNIVVKNFWEMEAEKAGGEAALANMVPYITSKLNAFIANDLIRPIIAQEKSSFNFRDIMDQGKILIVNLSKGKLGDINSYLLGMIIVGKILIAAMSRADIPEEERKDFYLYIDEFHSVTTKTITTILAEARKYRLIMIFAHQFIGQLDEETRKAIFGNVGSILAFRVGPEDADFLINEFSPVFSKNDLVNFDNYNGAIKLLINGESSRPFSVITFPPRKGNPEIVKIIKELSKMKYGQDRKAVEEQVYERLKRSY